ncbi:MAG: potassium channel family protein [Nitratireductor sp.]|nr:potassium channel family protein [Nitratireductor sp.]
MTSSKANPGFRQFLAGLYYGKSGAARIFRLVLVTIDIAAIGYFLLTVPIPHDNAFRIIDLALLVFFTLEFAARVWIADNPRRFFFRLSTLADILVLLSLALPLLVDNLGFLRILRTLRFMRSYRVMEELRGLFPITGRHEDVVIASINLAVFVFIVTSIVWVTEARINPDLNSWIDALYFTVTTLTTTGYGDITLKDPLGRLLTVLIMIFGVALFLRLAQSLFRPSKIAYTCPSCGLQRHDPDASHCKHCGNVVHIRTDGEW